MKKLNFLDPSTIAYDKIDENVMEIKSGITSLCADIQRFFKLRFNVVLTEKTPIDINDTFVQTFPALATITPLQLEQLKYLFCKIRTVNSYLFLNIPLIVPAELQEFFDTFPAPQYPITVNGELTVYGMIYTLAFFSQKNQIGSFIVDYFQSKYFINFLKRQTSAIQTSTQRYLYTLCGKGKPNFTYEQPFERIDAQNFNDLYRRNLTKILFGIEKCILKWNVSTKKEPPFHYLLANNEPFCSHNALTFDIIKLRNYCFHGVALFDKINQNEENNLFTLERLIHILIRLKHLLKNYPDYAYALQLIAEFGEKLIRFPLLRAVEESYKLLDKNLLDEEKIDSKIDFLHKFTERLEHLPPNYFEMAIELLDKDEISYAVNPSRFSDLLPREMQTEHLKIIKLTSEQFIKIDEFTSSHKEFFFILVDIADENYSVINGIKPTDLPLKLETYYSSKIGVYTAKI